MAPTGPTAANACRFELGAFELASGDTLASAWLDYRVFGRLNADRSNLILSPSSYGAWPEDISWAVGPILDPTRHCIVLVSQFGNGRSTSPSNGGPPLEAGGWPLDHRDNLRAQVRLLEQVFGVERPAAGFQGWTAVAGAGGAAVA
ncbi:MAG: homoserine acetyltransferase, partial [Cyanobium sp.]